MADFVHWVRRAVVRPGDRLWLVSRLRCPWADFPASLDARIEVAGVEPLDGEDPGRGGLRYRAGEGSRWFPLHDAGPCLGELRTRSGDGRTRPLLARPSTPPGVALQSLREVADPEPLLGLEERLASAGVAFVSYRLSDGTRRAAVHAGALVASGTPVFWDRWSLPRRLAERRERVDDPALDAHIEAQLRAAATVWGVTSPGYAEAGSYSRREMELARTLGTYRPVRA